MLSTTLNKLSHWFLHHRALSGYFEPVVQKFKPAWRQGLYRAKVLEVTSSIGGFLQITLQPQGNWLPHQAGQHIELTVEVNGRLLTRVFTISSSPAQFSQHKTIMLTIKRNKIGQFTPLLESKIVNNPWVNISAAKGEFNFKTTNEKQVVMVAAGSGITPLMSMLSQHISAVKQPIYLRYISPANEHQFVNELKMLAKTHTFFTVDFMTRTEHISQPLKLLSIHDVYCCGPQSLMQSIERLSLGVGAHYYQEHFSILPNISEEAEEVLVMLNGKPFKASNQQNLLTQLEAQSAPVTRGCGIGVCHQCHCHKKSGLVKNLLTGDVSDSGEQLIQLCISQPLSNLEIAS